MGTAGVGASADFEAIAGAFGPLLMVASLDYSAATVPIVAGPVFAANTPFAVIAAVTPIPGSSVPGTVAVPNVAALRYQVVFAQAFQISGNQVFASALTSDIVR